MRSQLCYKSCSYFGYLKFYSPNFSHQNLPVSRKMRKPVFTPVFSPGNQWVQDTENFFPEQKFVLLLSITLIIGVGIAG